MKTATWLAALALLAVVSPVSADSGDASAHVKLTDGQRATSEASNPNWLTLYADSTQLPRQEYALGDFCFWGFNAPQGITPYNFEMLREGMIRGVRLEMPWYGIQQNKTSDWNWCGLDGSVTNYVQKGFTVCGLLAYNPYWANHMRDRAVPPSGAQEEEVVDLASGSANLSHSKVLTNLPDVAPFVVAAFPLETTTHTDEIVCTNFQNGQQPRTKNYPIVTRTAQVWVDEGAGWTSWTIVPNLFDSPEGAAHCMIDRSGRVKFRNNDMYWYHGRTPKAGSRVKVSYQSIKNIYRSGLDYTVDWKTGALSRRMATITAPISQEDFNSSTLTQGWMWMNQPSSWNINQTSPGKLHVRGTVTDSKTPGNFLYQTVSGSGDFAVSAYISKLKKETDGVDNQCGLMIYQDANNWFRYALSNDSGRPILTVCNAGVVTQIGRNGEYGFINYAPRWVTIKKSGNRWTFFNSEDNPEAPQGAFTWEASQDQTLNFPLKVGVSVTGTDADGVDVDQVKLTLPQIGVTGNKVVVFYDYLDLAPWTSFVREAVNHFKTRIKYWEVWNEPDQAWCWQGGQEVFAEMLKEAGRVIHETDPAAKVVSGGYANGANGNLNEIYRAIGRGSFDMTAWHPYLFSNKAPDAVDWMNSAHNAGREAMIAAGDGSLETFLGEIASDSGVLANGGGMNERKQSEYAGRLMLMSRRLGWVKGMQWWPIRDDATTGEMEDQGFGAHLGLFSREDRPKPVYWMYRNYASNKGVILDLVHYDANSNPVPAAGYASVKSVVVGSLDRSKIASVKVLTSLTGTNDNCKPDRAAARFIGASYRNPIVATIATSSANLKTEVWNATAISATQFQVTGDKSGSQGTANAGSAFTSTNGVVQFTIPAGTYSIGDKYTFETFAGDGFVERANWINNGSVSGHGDITIGLPTAVDARYVSIQFVKAAGAKNIAIDEVKVLDNSGANLSEGKLYVVDGYQQVFNTGGPDPDPDPEPNPDPTPDPDPDPTPTPQPQPQPKPQLQLVLEGMPATPVPGTRLKLKINYKNLSTVSGVNVNILFPIPRMTKYVNGTASNSGVFESATNQLKWVIPTLAAGASGQLTFDVMVN